MAWKYRNKYGNKKTYAYGIQFDSKHEAETFIKLKILQDKGLINHLEIQKKYVLIESQYAPSTEIYKRGEHKGEPKKGKLLEKEVSYYADFDYYTKEGEHVVADAKGCRTKDYIIKRKLMLERYGIQIKEI